jgi:hypothetical protein
VAVGAPLEEHIDFCAHLLNKLHRHLTAYDLVTFHHRGANYPDALLLDAVLRAYLGLTEFAEQFHGDEPKMRRRRRALRQACLLRRHYQGHLVPDLPTSPGENARVLPASHPRVPEEQLTQVVRRRRQLFAEEPLGDLLNENARSVLAASVRDLAHPEECVELGLGVFIDRPLGYGKAPAEPDQTPMLAHEAFSPSIARRRRGELQKLCAELGLAVAIPEFTQAWPRGLLHQELAECPRPVAALTDVRRVANDFLILRTLPRGLKTLTDRIDWRPLLERFRLAFLAERKIRLLVQSASANGQAVLAVYDDRLHRRLEFVVDASHGFTRRAGIELPKAGLRVVKVWADSDPSLRASEGQACDITLGWR